jgi:hypothetical protein
MIRLILLLVLFGIPLSGFSQSNYVKRRAQSVPPREPEEKSETQPIEKKIRNSPAPQISAERMQSIEEAFYFVKGQKGSGSAFLMKDDSGVWLVSNSHVFEHVKSPKITNIRRDEISLPTTIEVATDRDLVRFRVDRTNGLSLAESCNYNQPICAFGDSGGAGVLTVLSGSVVAMGSDRLEISANIIPGNSGGPVINESNQVVGVSSYLLNHKSMPDWITKDTPFTETRRMALRLQGVKWIPFDFRTYQEEAGVVNDIEDGMGAFIDIATSLSKDIGKPITCQINNEDLQNWIRKHNRLADRVQEARNKLYYTQTSVDSEKDSLYRNVKRNLKGLTDLLETLEQDAGNVRQVTNPYFATKMKSYSTIYQSIREHMEAAYSGLN